MTLEMKHSFRPIVAVALVGLCVSQLTALAQPAPFDPKLPGDPTARVPQVRPMPATPVAVPVAPVQAAPAQPQYGPLPADILIFDAESKEFIAKPGEAEAKFVFNLTNVSASEITVTHVQTSCGCTVAHLTYPWKLAAGASGQIPVTMNLLGKSGVILKSVTVNTDKGQKPLLVKTTILAPDPLQMTAQDRERNQSLAKADRQAIFKGDCVHCHVEPVVGKSGKELYASACGICHDAEHRATMVADLRNLPNDTNPDYWKLMVTMGKPNTLMPAFSQAQGGPLSDAQVTSLVEYLVATMPAKGTNSRPIIINAKH